MENIALSTAAFCLWDIAPEEKLQIGRRLGFEHIEIALSTESMVRKFSEFLRQTPFPGGFKRVALHAPWHGVAYGQSARSQKLIAMLTEMVERLDAESLVVHCDNIQDPGVLEASGLPVCLENTAAPDSLERFSSYLDAFPWQVSLNLNKASREHGHLDRILERWHHRIERIHLSGHIDNKGRMPLQTTRQLDLIEKIKDLEVPMVMEGLFPPGEPLTILNERRLIRDSLIGIRNCRVAGMRG